MPSFTTLALAAVTAAISFASAATNSTNSTGSYKLVDNYNQSNFFNEFTFFSEADPTNGFVEYVAAAKANAAALAGFSKNAVYLGADFNVTNPTPGRASTRVTSKKTYSRGLIIADVAHMPAAAGVWPAFWTFGPNWPSSGEIDIIEGANLDQTDHMTLHTGPNCIITSDGSASSSQLGNGNCNTGDGKTGCSMTTTAPFGETFNKAGGGVYAVDWTASAISIYYFARNVIPTDITSGSPNPASWGTPVAKFNGGSGCNIGSVFVNHNLIFNTDFCGEWAGNEWTSKPELTALAPTCNEYVAKNPQAFTEAYWLINSVKVYDSASRIARAFSY